MGTTKIRRITMQHSPEAMLSKKELVHSMAKKLIDNVDSGCFCKAREVFKEIGLELDLLQGDCSDTVRDAGLESGC